MYVVSELLLVLVEVRVHCCVYKYICSYVHVSLYEQDDESLTPQSPEKIYTTATLKQHSRIQCIVFYFSHMDYN